MSQRRYVLGWDLLRLIAAIDIVGHHVGRGHALFGLGLPVFLLLGTLLSVSKPERAGFSKFARARTHRIILPWMFWSLMIGLGLALETAYGQPRRPFEFDWLMLLYGPEIHLWFLPFIAVAGCAVYALWWWLPDRRFLRAALAFAAGGCMVAALEYSPDVEWPFQQWIFGAAAIPLGYALGRVQALVMDPSARRREWWALFWLALVLPVAVFTYMERTPGLDSISLRYGGGVLLVIVAARWAEVRWWPKREALQPGQYMMGVYILHPSVYRWVVSPVIGPLGLSGEVWLRVALTFLVSLAIVRALRLTRLKSVL